MGHRGQLLAQNLHLVLKHFVRPVAVAAEQPGRADPEGAGHHHQLVGARLGAVVFPTLPGCGFHAEAACRLRDGEPGRLARPGYAAAYGVGLVLWSSGEMFACDGSVLPLGRSEEHTSELQSLMRISYAVFCLKKKKLQLNIAES